MKSAQKYHLLMSIIFMFSTLVAEEGMWPLSEIAQLDLNEQGLEIELSELYNPDDISLVSGICKVGGCSGSFVSGQGLILTNHHCAYRAIQQASTTEADYLQNGFLARALTDEIPAPSYTVRITESYQDVSEEVRGAIRPGMTAAERKQAVDQKINEIVIRSDEENPGMRSEVSEMFIGKTYVLFLYTYLKDVRLVYAPPRSIGNYGGETDNWIWPRHTGDFSFMRAYVAPDGSPAEYSPDNVPYQPKRVIEVAPEGVDEEDFVFILGYPGRTYRHRTSYHLAYEYEMRLPWIEQLYSWQIATMDGLSQTDRAVTLKLASRIKGLSNTMKNYRGKLLGIRRIGLVDQRREAEADLMGFIAADQNLQEEYGSVLPEIEAVYTAARQRFEYEMVLGKITSASPALHAAFTIYENAIEQTKPEVERKKRYTTSNFQRTMLYTLTKLNDYYLPAEQVLIEDIFNRHLALTDEFQLEAITSHVDGSDPRISVQGYIREMLTNTNFNDPDYARQMIDKSVAELEALEDPVMQFIVELYPAIEAQDAVKDARKGELDRLHNQLIDVKKMFLKEEFVPDANSTLRLTYGHIRGYSPADAVYCDPLTTLDGVIEKNTGVAPFDLPPKISSLYKKRDYGRYAHPKLRSVPVCMLYNMDTTGGNSGSAVFNAQGQLVGVNFDRAYEATINDFAWNEAYSRSIAVDIRYVLWVAEKYSGASELLAELGIVN